MRATRFTLERLALAALGLGTGTALFVYLVVRISIVGGLIAMLAVATTSMAVVWPRLPPQRRQSARRMAGVGVVGGVLALAAYDLTRLAVVALFSPSVLPFEAVPLFGQIFWGRTSPSVLTNVTGVVYHVCNGVGFGVAYTVLFGRRGAWAGVAWGVALEAAMLTVYPGWLDIRALEEFFGVTIAGHVVYGAVLGLVAQRLLARSPDGLVAGP